MLTKTDLSQLRKIIREEVETEVRTIREDLQAEIKLARMEIQTELKQVKNRLKDIDIKLTKMQKDISIISDLPKTLAFMPGMKASKSETNRKGDRYSHTITDGFSASDDKRSLLPSEENKENTPRFSAGMFIVNFFDKETIRLQKKVERLEQHIGIS